MKGWARRASSLHGEMTAVCETDPRWWLLAGGAAIAEPFAREDAYVRSDAEPGSDTFIGYRTARPADPLVDAIARARAARQALRELEGELPDQPLCVTVDRRADAALAASTLDVAAFAIGPRVLLGRLDDPQLLEKLRRAESSTGGVPFVCVSIGDDAIETARHAHRRAWSDRGGPWLGLGRTGDMSTVSTVHFVVDGYGHARITGRIAELAPPTTNGHAPELPALAKVADTVPLGVAWRVLERPIAGALPMAYALGRLLHRRAGRR
nr:hypothetical protein [Deltaproteobacteria bacterium]